MSLTHNIPDGGVIAAHVGSGVLVLGSLAGILPPLAALGAIIWYALQVYESKTVQAWLHPVHRDAQGNQDDDASHPPGTPG